MTNAVGAGGADGVGGTGGREVSLSTQLCSDLTCHFGQDRSVGRSTEMQSLDRWLGSHSAGL